MRPQVENFRTALPASPAESMRLVHRSDVSQPAAAALRVIERLTHGGPRPSGDVEDVRRRYEESRRPLLAPLEDIDSLFQASPRTGEGPTVRVIRPKGSAGQIVPAIVYLHGGGWTVGTFEIYEPLCRQLANATGSVVIYVRYRLAPEHPFPAAFEDTRKALAWVHANHRWLGVDPTRIGIAGDSSGGNLAASVSLAERNDRSPYRPRFQILLYPCLDMRACMPSHKTFAEGYLLTADLYRWYRQNYVGSYPKHQHWRLSPLYAHELADLPPAVVLYAGFDPLRDEAAAYVRRLRDAAVPVEALHFPDMIHGFMTMGGAIPTASVAVRRVSEALARLLRD
ncbi:MAG TPA: alpha/beta hydrolase [Rhizomicrobium sp.]